MKNEIPSNLIGKTFKDDPERASKAGKMKKGKKVSPKGVVNINLGQVRSNHPQWINKKMTVEQAHFTALLANNEFGTLIKDMLIFIASNANTADDYHKLLSQLMKIPFLQKTLQDIEKEQSKDVVPIVIEVLRKHGREDLIKEIYQQLSVDEKTTRMFEMRGVTEPEKL